MGSTIPTASFGNNNAMDNVIEAGIDAALLTLTNVIRAPMMHTEFAINFGIEDYPHNTIGADDHTLIEGQQYMAEVYTSFLLPSEPAVDPLSGSITFRITFCLR